MINNDVRRIKAKLKLFEEEGFSWVMEDIINRWGVGMITTEDLEISVKSLKKYYLEQLQELLPPDMQQGKLNL